MWALLTRARQVQILVALTIVVVLALEGISEWWSGQSLSPLKAISTARENGRHSMTICS